MNKIETNFFPLRCSAYSSSFQKKAEDALGRILPKDVLAQNLNINITGHKVEIGNCIFWFEPGTKKVFQAPKFDSNGQFVSGVPVVETVAKPMRSAIKALSNHASDLGVIKEPLSQSAGRVIGNAVSVVTRKFCSAPSKPAPQPDSAQLQKIALKADTIAQKTLRYLFPVSDLIGVIRNLIDLVQVVGTMVLSPWFLQTVDILGHEIAKSAVILGQCIAGFRIVQGCLSLAIGISKLYLAIRMYQKCKENHDAAGLSLAKDQMAGAALNIAVGLFWITLGILVLVCPQAMIAVTTIGIVFTVLQWVLFYGLFTSDSILSLKTATQNMQRIDRHYLYFINEILNNEKLTQEQRKAATKRFLQRVSEVTPTEKGKALEKLRKMLGHDPLSSEIETRLKQKRSKKCADLERTIGLDTGSVKNTIDSTDPVSRLLDGFETTKAQQDASRILSILCLVINAMGIQCDFSTFAGFLKVDHFEIIKKISGYLQLGLGGRACVAMNDAGWVAVNALYGGEDLPNVSLITRLFKKIGPKPHRNTLWWRQAHPVQKPA